MFKLSYLEPIFNPNFKGLLNNIPEGEFTDTRFLVVPYSVQPINFLLESTTLNEAVKISIVKYGKQQQQGRRSAKEINIVPTNERTPFSIVMSRGINIIIAQSGTQTDYIIVNATTYGAILFSYARELFSRSTSIIDEQSSSIFNKFTIKLAEPLLKDFAKYLPSLAALKILASKLIIKSLTHGSTSSKAVLDMTSGMTQNTPILEKLSGQYDIDFAIDSLPNSQGRSSGYNIHTWLPSFSAARRTSFIKLMSNLKNNSLQSINDSKVVVEVSGDIQQHVFEEDASSFIILRDSGTSNINMGITSIQSVSGITIIAAAYSLDLFITLDTLINANRLTFDSNYPWDSGLLLDGDYIDPWHDGYLGLKLTGRFEDTSPNSNLALDTHILPDASYSGPDYVYNGYYAQGMLQIRLDVIATLPVSMTGTII